MFDASYLAQHGITNLIEVDGMVYAAVPDLWSFFVQYCFDRLFALALFLVVIFVPLAIGELLSNIIFRLIRRKSTKSSAPAVEF